MKHEGAVLWVEELLRGELTDPLRRDVLAHVNECDDCRRLSSTYIALAEGFEASRSSEHPSSEHIVAHALGEDVLDPDRHDRVAAHLHACPSCAMEVEATRDAEQECHEPEESTPVLGRASVPRPARRVGRRFAAAAAAFLLVALALPVYRGLVVLPRVSSALEETRGRLDRMSSWSGVGSLPILEAPLRSSDAYVVLIEVAPAQPVVALAADPGLLDAYPDDSLIRFSIFDARERPIWVRQLAVRDVRTLTERTGVVTLFVPANQLESGRYVLELAHRTEGTEWARQPIFAAPFVVVRTD